MSTEDKDAAGKTVESDELKTPPAEGQQQEQQPAIDAGKQEQDDAAKLWAEFADDGAEKKPENTNGEKVSDEFTESPAEASKDAAADEQEKAETAPKGAKPADPAPTEDIWAKASPELRAAHEAEMAALRTKTDLAVKAQAGRIRKLHEERQKAAATRDADKPSSKKVGDILDEGLADYPEMAKPVKDALEPIEKKLAQFDRMEAANDAVQVERINEHIQSQQSLLEAAHPGWEQEYIQGPQAKKFADWIRSPDRTVKQFKTVFETNNEHIFDAAAAIEVFDAFKADTAGTGPTPANNGQTQELSAKRAAQLEGSRSPRTPGGPPTVTGIPREGDPQSIWKAFGDDNADDRLTRRRV